MAVDVEAPDLRARHAEDRLEELRRAVLDALAAHERGEDPDVIFRTLRSRVEHVPPGKWDQQNCIAKAHEWTALHGEPPAAINWNPASIKRTKRMHLMPLWANGDWPSYTTIRALFGTWNAFMALAGYEPRLQADPTRVGDGGGKGLEHLPPWHGWQVLSGYRERAGMTQARLADVAQVSVNYLGMIERGKQTNPTVRLLLGLSHALHVPASVLLDVGNEPRTR